MRVPWLDQSRQYQAIRESVELALRRSVFSEVPGSESAELVLFEHEFAQYCGARFAVGLNSGSDAICIALLCLGVGLGHEVLVPVNACPSVPAAVARTGAQPAFVDIDEKTWNISGENLACSINERTRAIIPVHSYGHPCDMAEILRIAQLHGVPVVEDASLAVGTRYHGRRVGSFGRIGVFSLGPKKILAAAGSAGALVTDDADIAQCAREYRYYGFRTAQIKDGIPPAYSTGEPVAGRIGLNSQLDPIQAAILRCKLAVLDDMLADRRSTAETYETLLGNLYLGKPEPVEDSDSAFRGYTVLVPGREVVWGILREQEIEAKVLYLPPLHMHPVWQHLGWHEGDFAVSERIAREMLSLPLFPGMREDEVQRVVSSLARGIAARKVRAKAGEE